MHIMTRRGWQPLQKVCLNHNRLEGVFRSVLLEDAKAENLRRADKFNWALKYDAKGLSFRGDQFVEPSRDPFGGYNETEI